MKEWHDWMGDITRKFYAQLITDGECRNNLGITLEACKEAAGKFYQQHKNQNKGKRYGKKNH